MDFLAYFLPLLAVVLLCFAKCYIEGGLELLLSSGAAWLTPRQEIVRAQADKSLCR